MIEALLVVWIGGGHSQTFSMTRYENMEVCESARKAVVKFVKEGNAYTDWIRCLPVKKD